MEFVRRRRAREHRGADFRQSFGCAPCNVAESRHGQAGVPCWGDHAGPLSWPFRKDKDTMRETHDGLSKVPEVTLLFWIIKILATTLGETGGDAVTMSMNLGYLVGTAIFAVVFVVAVYAQIRAAKFHPMLYWATIVASTTVGTTLADYADRSLGIGYTGGTSLLLSLLL